MLPWLMLKRAWKHYKKAWINQYGTVRAKNDKYYTLSVPVPTMVVMRSIAEASIIRLNSKK